MRKIVSENNLVFIITDQGLFYNNIPLEYIDKGEEADIIEGKYNGYVPIIVSQYGKLNEVE